MNKIAKDIRSFAFWSADLLRALIKNIFGAAYIHKKKCLKCFYKTEKTTINKIST